jgi:hypothetical protein
VANEFHSSYHLAEILQISYIKDALFVSFDAESAVLDRLASYYI